MTKCCRFTSTGSLVAFAVLLGLVVFLGFDIYRLHFEAQVEANLLEVKTLSEYDRNIEYIGHCNKTDLLHASESFRLSCLKAIDEIHRLSVSVAQKVLNDTSITSILAHDHTLDHDRVKQLAYAHYLDYIKKGITETIKNIFRGAYITVCGDDGFSCRHVISNIIDFIINNTQSLIAQISILGCIILLILWKWSSCSKDRYERERFNRITENANHMLFAYKSASSSSSSSSENTPLHPSTHNRKKSAPPVPIDHETVAIDDDDDDNNNTPSPHIPHFLSYDNYNNRMNNNNKKNE